MPKNIGKRTAWTGRDLRIVEISWEDGNGIVHKKQIAERIAGQDVVVIVGITDNDEIILVKEFRPSINAEEISLPGGKCDISGECVEDTAIREFLEEAGYRAKRWTMLFVGPVSPGLSPESMTVFLAEGLELTEDKSEDKIQVYKIPLDKLEKWLQEHENMGIPVDVQVRAFALYAKVKMGMKVE